MDLPRIDKIHFCKNSPWLTHFKTSYLCEFGKHWFISLLFSRCLSQVYNCFTKGACVKYFMRHDILQISKCILSALIFVWLYSGTSQFYQMILELLYGHTATILLPQRNWDNPEQVVGRFWIYVQHVNLRAAIIYPNWDKNQFVLVRDPWFLCVLARSLFCRSAQDVWHDTYLISLRPISLWFECIIYTFEIVSPRPPHIHTYQNKMKQKWT